MADNWKRPDGRAYSEKHVRLVKKCWTVFSDLSPDERPRWNDAYNSPEVRGRTHVNSAGNDEWYTPHQYIEAARVVVVGLETLNPRHVA